MDYLEYAFFLELTILTSINLLGLTFTSGLKFRPEVKIKRYFRSQSQVQILCYDFIGANKYSGTYGWYPV